MEWLFPTFAYLSACVICDRGKFRDHNQDNYYLSGLYRGKVSEPNRAEVTGEKRVLHAKLPALLAVADGMGGEQYGEEASFTVVEALRDAGKEQSKASLMETLEECNRRVCALRESRGGVMCGTTFAGVCLRCDRALIVNVGDSRIYLFRKSKLKLLTHDDTRVQMFLDAGLLDQQEASVHPDRNVLMQYLGLFPNEGRIKPHFKELRLRKGDLFLLCSDGLHSMIENSRIEELLAASTSIEEKADALFYAAMDAGGKDNITIILAKIST